MTHDLGDLDFFERRLTIRLDGYIHWHSKIYFILFSSHVFWLIFTLLQFDQHENGDEERLSKNKTLPLVSHISLLGHLRLQD